MFDYHIKARRNPQTRTTIYSAQLKPVTPIALDTIAEEITNRCTVTRHDIKACLSALQEVIIEHLLKGDSVRLGDLGSFHPRINSKSVSVKEDFKLEHIKRIAVRFTKGSLIKDRLRLNSKYVHFRKVD